MPGRVSATITFPNPVQWYAWTRDTLCLFTSNLHTSTARYMPSLVTTSYLSLHNEAVLPPFALSVVAVQLCCDSKTLQPASNQSVFSRFAPHRNNTAIDSHGNKSHPYGYTMSQYQNYPAPHSPSTNTDFSYPNFPGATNNQLGNFAQPAPRFDAAHFQQQVNRTMTHGQAVLQCRKASIAGRGGQGMGKAPVWTPHKAWLSEALDYVGRHIGRKKGMGGKGRGETFVGEMVGVDGAGAHEEGEHDGEVVVSLVLGPGGVDDEEDDTDDDGEHVDVRMRRTWLDGETVICEVATGLRSRKEKGRVLRAWDRTWQKGTSVVVIVGRGWGEAERCVPWPSQYAQWAVLDHLRVAEYWMEKRLAAGGKYEGVGVVKLQKAELHKESWWMVGREGAPGILPLDQRRFWGARWEESKRIGCTTCEEASPMVYKECWICLNQKCRNFWREGLEVAEDGSLNPVDIPRKLKFNADFLMARSMFEKDAKPSWELVPDLAQGFRTWKDSKTVLGITRSRLAWRGMVCQMCKSIVPKTQWCRWECENEDCRKRTGSPWFFDLDLGGVPLQSVVPRSFVSWKGHPLLEPTWADGLAGRSECCDGESSDECLLTMYNSQERIQTDLSGRHLVWIRLHAESHQPYRRVQYATIGSRPALPPASHGRKPRRPWSWSYTL